MYKLEILFYWAIFILFSQSSLGISVLRDDFDDEANLVEGRMPQFEAVVYIDKLDSHASGVLIDLGKEFPSFKNKLVLTAAHTLVQVAPYSIHTKGNLELASDALLDPAFEYLVAKTLINPAFQIDDKDVERQRQNDFGILILQREVKGIQPKKLYSKTKSPLTLVREEKKFKIVGFGVKRDLESSSSVYDLKKRAFEILAIYDPARNLLEQRILAEIYRNKLGIDTCSEGDSGAPLFYEGNWDKVVAIVSGASECSTKLQYTPIFKEEIITLLREGHVGS